MHEQLRGASHARGQGQRPRGATPRPRCRRAERSYSTFKVRRGSGEDIPLVQGKEQRLRFAIAAVKKYPTSKVRETKQDGRCRKSASEGRHTETIITEN